MNEFSFVVINVSGERILLKFESLLEMVAEAERLLSYEDVVCIIVDFTKITNVNELKTFEAGIRYFKNYLFNIR